MGVLPAQDIRRLCKQGWMKFGNGPDTISVTKEYLISPFTERGEFKGKTYGLGPCSFDLRLKHILTKDNKLADSYVIQRGEFILVSTIERVSLPHNVCGTVLDKSSWARKGLSAFNTHFDPGFYGYPTIELVNLGPETLPIEIGLPIVQMKFEYLASETELPYQGKYSNQPDRPVEAIEGQGEWGAQLFLSSAEWLKQPEFTGIKILDPDGWNRKNFDVSWAQKISKGEFERRLNKSTVELVTRTD